MLRIQSIPEDNLTEAIKNFPVKSGELGCWWLGQAGFALRTATTSCLIDPYLSDSLANKYKGTKFTHQRMIPIPVEPMELTNVDGIFCTHHHSDHMDSGTLPGILETSPSARLVCPQASYDRLAAMGLQKKLSDPVNPQMKLSIGDITITVIPASHETIEKDQDGNYRYVGYVLEAAGIRIYHSGDCIPFEGQTQLLGSLDIDLAMLPINGRDETRRNNNIPGNFTIDEAIELCHRTDISHLLCHHFDMFDFNTISRKTAQKTLERKGQSLKWLLPDLKTTYIFKFISN